MVQIVRVFVTATAEAVMMAQWEQALAVAVLLVLTVQIVREPVTVQVKRAMTA